MPGASLTNTPRSGAGRTSYHYELRSAAQRDAIATGHLPLGIAASEARRTMHRDVYLDTSDDVLRRRGVTCRARIGSANTLLLSLRADASASEPAIRLDAQVPARDVRGALAHDSTVVRFLRALVDPDSLEPQLELEVERLTRTVQPDFFRRPRFELHLDRCTARRNGTTQTFDRMCVHAKRGTPAELEQLGAALEKQHDIGPTHGTVREHAELLLRWKRPDARRNQHDGATPQKSPVANLLSAELSLVAFQRRVLAIAEDPRTPLKERLRFLGIVSSNIDELYMVRMSELREAAAQPEETSATAGDGLTANERLRRVEQEIDAVLDAQSRCAAVCLQAAESLGVRILEWSELTVAEQDALTTRCCDEIHPAITPLAMTLSPGHPLPHLPHLGLSLAVVFRRDPGGAPHLAEFELPSDVPRLIAIPGRTNAVIAIEALLRANVDLLHPNVHVDGAYLFRVTRRGDLALDEEGAEDLLTAVSNATERRPYNPAVRVEVERTMPPFVCDLVLESLRRDALSQGAEQVVDAVQVVDGMLDLRCLAALPLPERPELEYPTLLARAPIRPEQSMFDAIKGADLLVHHPFDAFDETVVRFLHEAAIDPAVTTIKITLYRVGDPSPVVAALLHAAGMGKRVVAFVELKARFDEEHNVAWARALERAGGNVVYGLVGLKTHAKVSLVVRREGEKLQRYVHVGTGNYNARAGRQYTDLSLFSSRHDIGEDVADLFNALTGSSGAPQGLSHGALVAPHQLLPAILSRIERETSNARHGRSAAIAIKVNGLSDSEIVHALYEASEAGVEVDLVVRGICTLRPGVAGLSSRIRVVSVVGRFLEHSRIYRFANDGAPEYFIGSSDLRPRNLRRRVELLVPISNAAHRAELDGILGLYLNDGGGWDLDAEGGYQRRPGNNPGAQAVLSGDEPSS